jgi:hypothetical protein
VRTRKRALSAKTSELQQQWSKVAEAYARLAKVADDLKADDMRA